MGVAETTDNGQIPDATRPENAPASQYRGSHSPSYYQQGAHTSQGTPPSAPVANNNILYAVGVGIATLVVAAIANFGAVAAVLGGLLLGGATFLGLNYANSTQAPVQSQVPLNNTPVPHSIELPEPAPEIVQAKDISPTASAAAKAAAQAIRDTAATPQPVTDAAATPAPAAVAPPAPAADHSPG